jgi:PPOX class probable F420-dependent enzyme
MSMGSYAHLPPQAQALFDENVFAVLSTVNPDGSPQSSVIWVGRDGDELIFSTVVGRRKTRNMQRRPQVSLCAVDPHDPYRYVEVRGRVSLTRQGGPDLIQLLSQRYTGRPFVESSPSNIRVVCRLQVTRVITRP